MMNANQQYPPAANNAYYQTASGYPKAYPAPPGQPSASMQNGHWPPPPPQQMPPMPPGAQAKKAPYPGGPPMDQQPQQQQQPSPQAYHSQQQQQAAAAYQQQHHPNAYYGRPPMHSASMQQQQYPPSNMSPQAAARHYPVPPQQQHPSQRFPNSYPNSPYRNDPAEGGKPTGYPYGPGANYNYDQQSSSRPPMTPQQQQQQQQQQQGQPQPPQQQQQPPPQSPYNQQHPQHQQQQPPNMYPHQMPSNMSPYQQRQYIDARNYSNHMNQMNHEQAARMRHFQAVNQAAAAAAMNQANYGQPQPRMPMQNAMATPPPPSQSPAAQMSHVAIKAPINMHPNFNININLRSASPALPAMMANDVTPVKKEMNDRHLRQALSAANVPSVSPLSSMMSLTREVRIDTVETTKPLFRKIRPLSNVGHVDNRKIMMSLKSGLLAETTWAFDVLNVLSHNGAFKLTTCPSLLTNLLDYYKCFLNSIFDDLFDANTENDFKLIKTVKSVAPAAVEENSDHAPDMCKEEFESLIRKDEKVYLLDSTNYTFKSRSGLPVQVKNEPRAYSSTGLPLVNEITIVEDTGDFKFFQDVNGLPTNHIVTNMDPIKELINFAPKSRAEKSKSVLLNGDAEVAVQKNGNGTAVASAASEGSSDSRRCKRKLEWDTEAELYRVNTNTALCPRRESIEMLIKRCHCLSTIIRNFSFLQDNAIIMARYTSLQLVLARLLAFSHEHYEKKNFARILKDQQNKSREKENQEAAEIFTDHCFDSLHLIRMNTLVCLSNMSEYLDLASYPDKIILPLLDGLLHWGVCPSGYARDTHPPDNLSYQLLALETIAKLSMKVSNIDLFLATPPFSRIEEFYKVLVGLLNRDEEQVLRELSIVILSNFAAADVLSARIILHQDYSIYNLIMFIEQYDYTKKAQLYNRFAGFMEPFTITYMLKQAATTMRTLATECDRQDLHLIKKFEDRIVDLTTSHVLDSEVSQVLADLIFILANSEKSK